MFFGFVIPLVGSGVFSYDPQSEHCRWWYRSGGETFIRLGKVEVIFTPRGWKKPHR